MSTFICNTAVSCGLITAICVVVLATFCTAIYALDALSWAWRKATHDKSEELRDRLLSEIHQMDRWLAENDYVVACCERLRNVVDDEPVEHISEWREKIRKIDDSGESLVRRLEAKR